MDKESYKEINMFSLFGFTLFKHVKTGVKYFQPDYDEDDSLYHVQVSKDYYDREFDIDDD